MIAELLCQSILICVLIDSTCLDIFISLPAEAALRDRDWQFLIWNLSILTSHETFGIAALVRM